MDAAQKLISKIPLFSAIAFLVAAPALAQTLVVGQSTVTLPIAGGQTFTNVAVTSTGGGAEASFTVSKPPNDGWYSVTTSQVTACPSTLTPPCTPANLTIQLLSGLSQTPLTSTITLQNTTNTSDPAKTITVNYVPGGSGGTGVISVSQTSWTPNLVLGGSAGQNFTLSTTSTASVPFGVTVTGQNNSPVFVTYVVTPSFQVSASSPVNLALTANTSTAGIVANGVYNNAVTISPGGGSGSTVINVTMTVGAGGTTGTFQVSQNQVFFTFPSGTQSTCLTVTSSGGSFYNVSASSSNSWLLLNNSSTQLNNVAVGTNSLCPSVNFSAAQSLVSGTYFGTITLTNPNNASDQTSVQVQLSVSGGQLSNLNLSSTSVTFNVPPGTTALQQQNLTASAANGQATTFSLGTTGQSWLSVFSTGNTFSSINFTVSANPTGLAAGTYTGGVTILTTGGVNGQQTIPVTLNIGGTGTGTVTGVAPASLTFGYQANIPNQFIPQQTITVGGTGTISVSVLTSGNQQWLSATGTGAAPGFVVVGVNNNASQLGVGTYNGTITITTGSGTTNVPVTLVITNNANLQANPATINLTYQAGGQASTTQITISTTDNSNVAYSVASSASWVTVSPNSGSTPSSVSVTVNPAGLANGINTATLTVTATGTGNSPMSIPVVVTVTGSTSTGQLTLSTSALTFNTLVNGSSSTQQLTVSSPSTTTFVASTTIQSGGTNWLTTSPSGSLNTPQTLSVTANPAGLAAGTYTGSIILTANGVSQTVTVTMVVGGSSGGATVTVTPASLDFTSTNGVTPGALALSISSLSGNVNFTINATTASGGSWLNAGVQSGATLSTPVTLSVTANPSGLAGGTYNGTITITPAGGAAITVPVTLTVTTNVISATTSSGTTLSLNYRVGDTAPAGQQITVSGNGSFTATAQSNGNWLTVSPTSGSVSASTPATLNLTVNPANLAPGTLTGTVVVAGSGTSTGSTTITVNLTVTAPLPTITRVTNAASYASGAIAPGEIITIFGVAIGPPAPGVGLALDSSGRVATTIGNVQVLVNGFLAPMIYASATQVSASVPYEVKGQLSATVQVRYLSQTSNGVTVPIATTAPGIFTANASGSGPAAIIYPNPTLATATRGDIIVIFATGEGETNPPGITGGVTTVSPTPPITPMPLLPVVVLIDGQPAEVLFVGEAPGFISGALQLNVRIPANAQSGNVSLVLMIGGNSSQVGVTVPVR